MGGVRVAWLVATAVGVGATTIAAAPGPRTLPRLLVPVPGSVGFSFGRFELFATPGSSLPAHPRLALLNRSKLPQGLVAVALIGRLAGGRPGLDVFVTLIRERTIRSLADRNPEPGNDALFGIIAGASHWAPTKNEKDFELLEATFDEPPKSEAARALATQAQPLQALLAQPARVVEALAGPARLDYLRLESDNVELLGLIASRAPIPDVDEVIEAIERVLANDLNGDGAIGPPAKKPPPKQQLYRFSFGPLGLGFDWASGSPPVPVHQGAQIQGGTGCGTDPLHAQWQITWSGTGTTTRTLPYSFVTGGNQLTFDTFNFSDGSKLTMTLHLITGSSPAVQVEETHTGNIQNVSVAPQAAPIDGTPVGSC